MMADLTEEATWANGVYQIAETDPLHGGVPNEAQGIGQLNWAPKNLADRTAWLKAQVARLDQLIIDLTNGAPGALDTLNELATALGNDPNFAATITGMVSNAAPAGIVSAFAATTPPTGWLECNGATISRASYAKLFTAIGTTHGAGDGNSTFKLPDLRGEFLRGWDNGRGVDAGRSLGQLQDDATAKNGLYHLVHTPTGSTIPNAPNTGNNQIAFNGNYQSSGMNIQNSGAIAGDAETRPRNISLMFCIKY